jgi:uncharacterized protein (TIGR02246 family)
MRTPKPSAAHSKDATASVKSVVASLAESWNRHDMAAFAAAFCDDADFVNVIGMHWQGRQEIEAKHAQTHRTIFRNSCFADRRSHGALPDPDHRFGTRRDGIERR